MRMKATIEHHVGDSKVEVDELFPGRPSSFEVEVDRKYLVASKLRDRGFPDYDAVASQIAEYAQTGKPHPSWQPIKQ